MGGMNYSRPAPLIYFTSARERQGRGAGGREKGDAKQAWCRRCIVYFYFHWAEPFSSHGQSFQQNITNLQSYELLEVPSQT